MEYRYFKYEIYNQNYGGYIIFWKSNKEISNVEDEYIVIENTFADGLRISEWEQGKQVLFDIDSIWNITVPIKDYNAIKKLDKKRFLMGVY